MDDEQREQLKKQVESRFSDILADFDSVIKKYSISGVHAIGFILAEKPETLEINLAEKPETLNINLMVNSPIIEGTCTWEWINNKPVLNCNNAK